MKNNYPIRKTEKLLRERNACRHALGYLTSVRGASLSLRKEEILQRRIRYLSRTVAAVEQALDLLEPTERKIVEGLYFEEDGSVERVCAACALEKSSVYRYRARALGKLAAALYGE